MVAAPGRSRRIVSRSQIRDLPCFGRPARLVWWKRRWRCREPLREVKTWTETSEHLGAQVVLTRGAGAEACRQVGELARPVSKVAEEFGVCWWTIMNAVIEHGTRLVDDPERIGRVRQLGVDETSFLKANRAHSTVYATGLVDLERHVLIDMTEGNSAKDLSRWLANADGRWLAGTERLDERGHDRMLLGLRVGDPHDEVLGAWLAKESVRDVYLAENWRQARTLLDKAIAGCVSDDVPEIVSLGNTLKSWRREILARHTTGASNGPTEGLNLCVKKVKRCGHGFRSFDHYRLRVLLHAGGVTWPARPQPLRIRTRAPQSFA